LIMLIQTVVLNTAESSMGMVLMVVQFYVQILLLLSNIAPLAITLPLMMEEEFS